MLETDPICLNINPMFDIHKHFEIMNGDNVMISYRGVISGDIISSILQFAETKFSELQTTPFIRKKVISILLESLQNIFHHAVKVLDAHESTSTQSMLMIGRSPDGFFIATGNKIEIDRAKLIKQKIDDINAMSKDELNQNYRDILVNKIKVSEYGAGVGMIDIARRSGQKIEYDFKRLDDQFCFFSLRVHVLA
jgi:hypothetical protein